MSDQMRVSGQTNYRLPPELVDKIVANLDNDKYTLSSLSLVCELWFPLLRSRLFDRIRISPNNQKCDRIVDRPSLTGSIRHVAFILSHFLHSRSDERDQLEYLFGVIKRMGQTENYIKSLTITFDRRPNFEPYRPFFDSLPTTPGFSDIVELNIMIGGKHLYNFIPFICSFPRLKSLSAHLYHAVHSNEYLGDYAFTCTLPTSLETLQLNIPAKMVETVGYLDKWLSLHPPSAISNLTICSSRPWLSLQPYVSLCAENLRYLTLTASNLTQCFLDLSEFQMLECLTTDWRTLSSSATVLCHAIETISSARFRKIAVINIPSTPSPASALRLDQILTTEPFSTVIAEAHLTSVKPGSLLRRQEEVMKIFTRCAERGRLEITQLLDHKTETRIWRGWKFSEPNVRYL